MNHSRIVSRKVIRCILEANNGCWPVTLLDLCQVARRFGATVVFRDPALIPGPFLRNSVIYIPLSGSISQMLIWLTHEVAEAALIWDGEPPYVLPGPCDGLEAHRIARLTEQATYYRHSTNPHSTLRLADYDSPHHP